MAERKRTPEVYRQRIIDNSEPVPWSGCWIWMMSTNEKGYGRVYAGRADGRQERAHRVSYRIFKGEIPEGMIVCHRCDVPSCVNPDHLFLGSLKDNTQDMLAKGRNVPMVGEMCGRAVLTEKQVREARRRYQAGDGSHRSLAEEYGVSKGAMCAVLTGRSWAHIL